MHNKQSKLSPLELLLLLILIFCYCATLLFLFRGNAYLFLLFFILHSCIGLVYIFVSQNKLLSRYEQARELSYDRNTQKQILNQKKEELERLQKKFAKSQQTIEGLRQDLEDAKVHILSLEAAVQEASSQDLDIKDSESMEQLLPFGSEGEKNAETLDIIQSARAAVKEMEPFTQKAGITVQISSSSASIAIKANPSLLRILFRNIIDNSVKYMRRTGRLVITISCIGDDLFIVLKDNGDGLDTKETEHIFELNYQGSNRVSGNGLGLTQARAIVRHYGGTIYAKSSSGNGMAIYIQLPSAASAQEEGL